MPALPRGEEVRVEEVFVEKDAPRQASITPPPAEPVAPKRRIFMKSLMPLLGPRVPSDSWPRLLIRSTAPASEVGRYKWVIPF
jgi:hypothetical protein